MPFMWTTKAGQQIPITKMTDDHVRNTYRMLINRAEQWADEFTASACYSGRGEMANYYAGLRSEEALDKELSFRNRAEIFREEMVRRGIA